MLISLIVSLRIMTAAWNTTQNLC